MKLTAVLLLSLFVAACGDDSPTSPSPNPSPTPNPTTVSLSGVVTAQGGARLAGATVRFMDGANAGLSTSTNGSGEYRFDGIRPGNTNLAASAPDYEEARAGVNVNNNTLNFTLRTLVPWTRAGFGNAVFDMPTYFARVRIRGVWNGSSTSNFIVRIGGRGVVNEILREMPGRTYEGVHLTNGGGVVEITSSGNIAWTFTEER